MNIPPILEVHWIYKDESSSNLVTIEWYTSLRTGNHELINNIDW